jgi:hypothetical protein
MAKITFIARMTCKPDKTAEHRHMNSKLLAETGPKISACLIGTWEREYFDGLE